MLRKGKVLANAVRDHFSLYRTQSRNMQIAPLQKSALEERCILVNENDEPVGEASKRDCHRIGKDNSVPLHRAFSVFLFDGKGDLLLQKRSSTKITFPGHYTNTCCSHPLAEIPCETEEENAIGVCKAAQRRLGYELGTSASEFQPRDFFYLTRIYYQSPYDHYWGEHEIDYVLFVQKNNVKLDPNPDEVSEICWVARDDIDNFVKNLDSPMTPWFKLILEHRLHSWWDNLKTLQKIQDHETIQRFV